MSEVEIQEVKEVKKDKKNIVNLIFTIVQVVLIVVCVVASIFIIINPSTLRAKPDEFSTDVMVVMTDSMEPTISANDIIFGSDVPEGVLPLGTVITFAVKTNEGYYLDTHRIVGYVYTYVDSEGKTFTTKSYYVKGEFEDASDLDSSCTILGYATRGDKYTFELGATLDDCRVYDEDGNINYSKDDAGYRSIANNEVLAVWNGGKIGFIGTVVKFLQDPLAFGLIILLPLVLLFAYNVFLIVKMIIADKTEKAREAALNEVRATQLDEEEIKRKAIEEYLASMKKDE